MVIAAGCPATLSAADFTLNFGEAFSGAPPAGTPPWAAASFQTLSPGRVLLTLKASNLSGNENIDEVYFNLNTNLNPLALQFQPQPGIGSFDLPRVATGTDKFKAGGDGKYDVKFTFSQGATAANRFTLGETFVTEISGIPMLTAADFLFLSSPVGGAGPFYAAAHVQRIGTGSLSGWVYPTDVTIVGVPEPGVGTLWLLAALVWFALSRLKPVASPRLTPALNRIRSSRVRR